MRSPFKLLIYLRPLTTGRVWYALSKFTLPESLSKTPDLDEKTVLFLSAYSDPMSSAISSKDLIWFVFPIASPFFNCIDLATLFI